MDVINIFLTNDLGETLDDFVHDQRRFVFDRLSSDGPRRLVEGPMWAFVDWVMDDLAGLEMCRRLRADPRTSEAHVTMVLEEDDAEDRRRALRAGADVIVNTDADNQYRADYIPALTAPIVEGTADLVVGARPIADHQAFSPVKKILQLVGSWVVRSASGTNVPDAPSGFRAISRALAMRLYVFNSYTYTLETLIQAGRLNVPVTSVPVEVNAATRSSRLMRSIAGYVFRSATTIVRIFALYHPLRFFGWLAVLLLLPGVLAFSRFLFFYLQGDGSGHLQSLVIGAAFITAGSVAIMGGVLADLIAANRMLMEEVRRRLLEADLRDRPADKTRND